jgi:2-polyprenyl-6-methoxyphenol hydroxylase-like FAD-dependent oxidoreductase
LQRCDLLKVLSSTVHDQSTVHTSKRVYAIDHHDMGVVVHCEDGTEYSGDIVVGADGIRSTVRFLMQQHIETTRPGVIEKDRNSISAEYSCIFGVGNPVEGVVKPGDGHRSYSKNYSTLSFVGRGGKLYWFLFSKLEKRCHGNDIPRYTTADMEEAVKAFYQIYMTDTITFREVWEQRTFANMLCIEESKNEHWTSDRFVCLGDAVHKVCQRWRTLAS